MVAMPEKTDQAHVSNTAGTRSGLRRQRTPPPKDLKVQFVSFVFGVVDLLICLVLAIDFPSPTTFQKAVFAVLAGLGASAIANLINGDFQISSRWLKATGPIAVFAFTAYLIVR